MYYSLKEKYMNERYILFTQKGDVSCDDELVLISLKNYSIVERKLRTMYGYDEYVIWFVPYNASHRSYVLEGFKYSRPHVTLENICEILAKSKDVVINLDEELDRFQKDNLGKDTSRRRLH